MITLGKTKLGVKPNIAVVFDDRAKPSALKQVKLAGVSIAELRLDLYSKWNKEHVLGQIKKFGTFSRVATIRSKAEGGKWTGSDAERFLLFKTAIPYVDAVDIELSSKILLKDVIKAAHAKNKKAIISCHNFKQTPALKVLNETLRKSKGAGADIVKIAAFVNKPEDLSLLAQFTSENAKKNIIVIGMGPKGALSRILFPSLGSLFTYASLGDEVAPGQFSYQETARLFKLLYASK